MCVDLCVVGKEDTSRTNGLFERECCRISLSLSPPSRSTFSPRCPAVVGCVVVSGENMVCGGEIGPESMLYEKLCEQGRVPSHLHLGQQEEIRSRPFWHGSIVVSGMMVHTAQTHSPMQVLIGPGSLV